MSRTGPTCTSIGAHNTIAVVHIKHTLANNNTNDNDNKCIALALD